MLLSQAEDHDLVRALAGIVSPKAQDAGKVFGYHVLIIMEKLIEAVDGLGVVSLQFRIVTGYILQKPTGVCRADLPHSRPHDGNMTGLIVHISPDNLILNSIHGRVADQQEKRGYKQGGADKQSFTSLPSLSNTLPNVALGKKISIAIKKCNFIFPFLIYFNAQSAMEFR